MPVSMEHLRNETQGQTFARVQFTTGIAIGSAVEGENTCNGEILFQKPGEINGVIT